MFGRGGCEEVDFIAATLTRVSGIGRQQKEKTAPWIGRGFVTTSEALEAKIVINGAACLFSLPFSQVALLLFSLRTSWPSSSQVS